jgi:hypothetical protein
MISVGCTVCGPYTTHGRSRRGGAGSCNTPVRHIHEFLTRILADAPYALEEEKPVIPILLRSCAIPFRLRRVQYINLTANYETGFSHLLRALRLGQPLQPSAPVAPQELFVRDVSEERRQREKMEGPNLSLDQAAQAISVTRATLRDYIKSGRVKANPDGTIEAVELLRAGFIIRTLPRRGEEEVGSQ